MLELVENHVQYLIIHSEAGVAAEHRTPIPERPRLDHIGRTTADWHATEELHDHLGFENVGAIQWRDDRGCHIDWMRGGETVLEVFTFTAPILPPVVDLERYGFAAAFHGVIFKKTQDPFNSDGAAALYAPDVVHGPDGRFYLYYCVAGHQRTGVAVAQKPIGPFEFLDHVRDATGHIVGSRPRDVEPFDPGGLVDDGRIWLYSGSGPHPSLVGSMDRELGSIVMELEPDMVTLRSEPRRCIPTLRDAAGTSFQVTSSSRQAHHAGSATSSTSCTRRFSGTNCAGHVLSALTVTSGSAGS